MKRSPNATVPWQVRMPEGIRRAIAAAAKDNGRSMNSEIVWRLRRSLATGDNTTAEEKIEQALQLINAALAQLKG